MLVERGASGVTIRYIHAKPPNDELADTWYRGAGWYWPDCGELLSGPHDSFTDAEIAQRSYEHWLNQEIKQHEN